MDENNVTYDKIVDVEISDKMKSAYIYHELGKGGLPKVIS